ncbi:unnamed protein product, partial [marine sediment metagenome]
MSYESVDRWPPDFEYVAEDVEDVIAALGEGEHVSIVSEDDIEFLDLRRIGQDRLFGTFTFGRQGLWRGRLDFLAAKPDRDWVVESFRLPGMGIELRPATAGFWTPFPLLRRAYIGHAYVIEVRRVTNQDW